MARRWQLRVLRGAFVAGALATSGACADSLVPEAAEPFRPPAIYGRWWAMTEACSGRRGDFRAIQWYRLPGSSFSHEGDQVSGLWTSRRQIVLAEHSILEGPTVRHEMLHELVRAGGHPRDAFLDRCAGLVGCYSCDTDQWRAPAPYLLVAPDSLRVTSEVVLLPRESDGERWLAVTVRARNPYARAVLVNVLSGRGSLPTFLIDVRGPLGGRQRNVAATDSSALFFAAHETKSWLFEFLVADSLGEFTVPPGRHRVTGGYAWHRSAAVELSIER